MKSKYILWAAIAVGVVAIAAFALRPAGGGVSNVDAAGATKAIEAGAQVIDVRSAGEFELGHLPGAVNVPINELEARAQAWDRDATYLVYCATGARSTTAVQIMTALGFGNIRHFNAGLQAWNEPLEKGGSASTTTIETAGLPVMVEFFTDS